jgi:hypothetical protein
MKERPTSGACPDHDPAVLAMLPPMLLHAQLACVPTVLPNSSAPPACAAARKLPSLRCAAGGPPPPPPPVRLLLPVVL